MNLRPLTVIGLNSGTSMDGIDAAVFSIEAKDLKGRESPCSSGRPQFTVKLLGSELFEFEPAVRASLQRIIGDGRTTLQEVCLLNVLLGELFASAAQLVCKTASIALSSIDLIGSHGQTVWHQPDPVDFAGMSVTGTLQLGEPSIISAKTGVPVVADFRPSDMAYGGQGAPLVSFADEVLFGQDKIPTGVLNIGGIANITVINGDGEATIAFDTGPGNMLIDRACERLFSIPYDEGGSKAAAGKVNTEWLAELLAEPYYSRRPPKTTGRELFGLPYADRLIDAALGKSLTPEDVVSTFTALTSRSIAEAYSHLIQDEVRLERLIIGGGGAFNTHLLECLAKDFPRHISILNHDDVGVPAKFKESLLFALLAYTTYFGIPNNVPQCTGASRSICLGKIVAPLGIK